MKKSLFGILAFIMVFMVLSVFISCETGDGNGTGNNENGNNNGTGNNGNGNDNGSGNNGDGNGSGNSNLGLNGTWSSNGNYYIYTFNNGSFEYILNGNPQTKGTYTYSDNSMTMTITQNYGARFSSSYTWLDTSIWYSKSEFEAAYYNYYRASYKQTYTEAYGKWTQSQMEEMVAAYRANIEAGGYTYTSGMDTNYRNVLNTQNASRLSESEIDEMVETQLSSLESVVTSALNVYYTTTTVSYSLNGDTLIHSGITYTRG